MKNYYLKIRDKYIDEIILKNKIHEYRLATPERNEIKVGDTLVMISNQDKNRFVKVTVKAKQIFKTWKDALIEYWQQDFKNLYNSLEDALYECYKFYPKMEVDRYGIIVYSITPLVVTYDKIDILLDTNILIKRESNSNTSFEISKLFNWFNNKKLLTYIHKSSKNEIEKYKDKKEMQSVLTKLNSYNVLPVLNCQTDNYFNEVINKYSMDENSSIDNELLKEIYNDNVGILLTDDNVMLKKAEELYIRDRVLSSSELLNYFETKYPQNIEYKMLSVKLKEFKNIDLNSQFFDTLREDYNGVEFDRWFKKKAAQKEKAYTFENEDGMKGFLYLKTEDKNEKYDDISPKFPSKNRLKVGTFKIISTGFRLGERFLKIIFDNARKFNVDEIYVTLFENKREEVKQLKRFMESWGFRKWGYKDNGEAVLVKSMIDYDNNESPKFNYPLLKNKINYFFLPIYPQYHTDLFPDMILQNENMHLYEENKAHRYALEKIYLSGALDIKAKVGDIVIIYRTGERYPKRYSSVVTGIAIIEEIIRTKDVDDCIKICKDRSIFSEEEIKVLQPKYPVVVRLLDYATLKNKVSLNQLYKNQIIVEGSGPRPFQQLNKEEYTIIYNLGMGENL
jgi:hypothetical protein